MDYEKKYNEALERFMAFKEKYYTKNTVIGDAIFDKTGEMQRDFESIFPQLRESEDERIRKVLIDALKVSETIGELKFRLPYLTREECIAYLEKQEEQKPAEWSEDDKNMWTHLNGYLNGFSCSEDAIKQIADWFYELPDRFNLQPKQEWSEEDEKQLDDIISIIREAYEHGITISETRHRNAYSWLNNLRPSWKPSEEQMEELCLCIPKSGQPCTLQSLYNDLKKL